VADEEFKVEVELRDESFWERLKTLDIDDEARKRLGSRVTVTRDGDRIQLYTRTLADAQEALATAQGLVADDGVEAAFEVSHWDSAAEEWVDASGHVVDEDVPEAAAPDPSYVILEAYKPEFLRDLGL
jgi:hypothetical protein